MPKILFPENAWTLGTLQGVNVVSNRVAPSKEIKVTVTNNTENDLTGTTLVMIPHNYVFDLVDLSRGEPQFYTESGDLLPYTITHTLSKNKKQFGCFLQPTVEETPISFNVGETITLVCGSYSEAKPLGIPIPTPWEHLAPNMNPPGGEVLIGANAPRLAWFFCGSFKEFEEPHIINKHNTSTGFTIHGNIITGYNGRTYVLPNRGPFLGLLTSGNNGAGNAARGRLFDPDTGAQVLVGEASGNFYSGNNYEYIYPDVFVPGTTFLCLTDIGVSSTSWWLSTGTSHILSTVLPFLRGDYSLDWSFSSPEEMYWLSPIIQLPYELNLATINWSEIGGFGRIDVDEFDPQDYEIRYSVEPPEGDAAGTIPDTDGNQLNYWTPSNSWTEAGSWQIKEKNTGGGPMKFVQIRIRFQG